MKGGGGHEFTFEKAGTHIELLKKKKKRQKWRNNSIEEVSPADHKACCSTITVQQCKTVWPISCGFPDFSCPLIAWLVDSFHAFQSLAQLMLHFVEATERPTPVPSSPHGFWNCSVLPNHWRCTSGVYVPCIYSHTRWEAPQVTLVFVVMLVWHLSNTNRIPCLLILTFVCLFLLLFFF